MPTPLVTVGLQAYNHERFVAEAVESVLKQSFKDFELIVVDDASTDGTLDVIRKFSDPRIKVIAHSRNQGPGGTANDFIHAARGEWISCLPSDDVYRTDRLEKQLAHLEQHKDVGLLMSEVEFIDDGGKPLPQKGHFASHIFDFAKKTPDQWLRSFFENGNSIAASGVIWKTSYREFPDQDCRLLLLQDFDRWVRLAVSRCNFDCLQLPLTYYRIHSNGNNLSTPTAANFKTRLYEHSRVLQRFLRIDDAARMRSIFPEIPVANLEPEQQPVWIAHRLAERAWNIGRPEHRQFALDTWFSIFTDEKAREWLAGWGMPIKQLYGYMEHNPLAEALMRNWRYKGYFALAKILTPEVTRTLRELAKRFSAW